MTGLARRSASALTIPCAYRAAGSGVIRREEALRALPAALAIDAETCIRGNV